LTAEDQEKLRALTDQVYAIPSNYVAFKRVRDTLNNTNDLRQVLSLMQAVNPGITSAKILADIDQHLGIIATKRNEFNNAIAQTREARISGPTREMGDLTQANQQAAQEIERIQRQIADRQARITQLQATIADANRAIAEGENRFTAIEDQLKSPLVQAKQILSSSL
jgi:peptidoglycan hydrolase CwlO-like protein